MASQLTHNITIMTTIFFSTRNFVLQKSNSTHPKKVIFMITPQMIQNITIMIFFLKHYLDYLETLHSQMIKNVTFKKAKCYAPKNNNSILMSQMVTNTTSSLQISSIRKMKQDCETLQMIINFSMMTPQMAQTITIIN